MRRLSDVCPPAMRRLSYVCRPLTRPAMRRLSYVCFLSLVGAVTRCPGTIEVANYDAVCLVNAVVDPSTDVLVDETAGIVTALLGGRTYWGTTCSTEFDPSTYVALPLLDRTLSYTVDLSGGGCGCNAALYLVSMAQNDDASTCGDYYCDANAVGHPHAARPSARCVVVRVCAAMMLTVGVVA